jgi:hypothetical protein
VKRALVAIATVLLGVLVVGGSVVALSWFDREPAYLEATPAGTMQTPKGELPHATLELEILPNTSAQYPGPAGGANVLIENNGVEQDEGWPFYWPSTSIKLPAHTAVTVTIKQYDGSSPPWNPYWAQVHGTVGGTATFNGKELAEIDSQRSRAHVHDPSVPAVGPGELLPQRADARRSRQRQERGQWLSGSAGHHLHLHHPWAWAVRVRTAKTPVVTATRTSAA